jgi:hypothetical protein
MAEAVPFPRSFMRQLLVVIRVGVRAFVIDEVLGIAIALIPHNAANS